MEHTDQGNSTKAKTYYTRRPSDPTQANTWTETIKPNQTTKSAISKMHLSNAKTKQNPTSEHHHTLASNKAK